MSSDYVLPKKWVTMSLDQEMGYSWDQLLRILRCPVCHRSLKFEPVDQGLPHAREYGVLSCGCRQYPVIDGVPVLKRGKVGVFEHTKGYIQYEGPSPENLTRLVLDGRGLDALLLCIALPVTIKLLDRIPPWRLWHSQRVTELLTTLRRRQLRKWCVADRDTLTAKDWFEVFFGRFSPVRGDLFNYFLCRFAQPRHLAVLALMRILSKSCKPVLDLACGFGHLGHDLTNSPTAHAVVGVDRNFFQVWTAQYWIAPKARFVCGDADQPLPFADASFSGTLCSDAFHYFQRKDVALGEIMRCAPGQPILLARVGNKQVKPNEGFELTPQEYLSLCGDRGWHLFGETELVQLYLRKEPINLSTPRSVSTFDGEKWLSIVYPGVKPAEESPQDTSIWLHAVGTLGINPIYSVSRAPDGTRQLQFKFPSDHYAFENAPMVSFHPRSVSLREQTYREVFDNVRSPEVERLIRQFVAIGLPHRYARSR